MIQNTDNTQVQLLVQKLTCLVVQQEATDKMVVLAVGLLLKVKRPEGCSH